MSNADHISEELQSMGSPLAGMPRTMPYTLPDGYFGQNAHVIGYIPTEHGTESANWGKTQAYTVPAGYFTTLPGNIRAAIAAEQKAETAPLRLFRSVQWAAAAIVIIAIGIGSYMTFPGAVPYEPDKILASVPGTDIHDYIQRNYREDVDRIVANTSINKLELDNKEIIQYLDETGWDVVD